MKRSSFKVIVPFILTGAFYYTFKSDRLSHKNTGALSQAQYVQNQSEGFVPGEQGNVQDMLHLVQNGSGGIRSSGKKLDRKRKPVPQAQNKKPVMKKRPVVKRSNVVSSMRDNNTVEQLFTTYETEGFAPVTPMPNSGPAVPVQDTAVVKKNRVKVKNSGTVADASAAAGNAPAGGGNPIGGIPVPSGGGTQPPIPPNITLPILPALPQWPPVGGGGGQPSGSQNNNLEVNYDLVGLFGQDENHFDENNYDAVSGDKLYWLNCPISQLQNEVNAYLADCKADVKDLEQAYIEYDRKNKAHQAQFSGLSLLKNSDVVKNHLAKVQTIQDKDHVTKLQFIRTALEARLKDKVVGSDEAKITQNCLNEVNVLGEKYENFIEQNTNNLPKTEEPYNNLDATQKAHRIQTLLFAQKDDLESVLQSLAQGSARFFQVNAVNADLAPQNDIVLAYNTALEDVLYQIGSELFKTFQDSIDFAQDNKKLININGVFHLNLQEFAEHMAKLCLGEMLFQHLDKMIDQYQKLGLYADPKNTAEIAQVIQTWKSNKTAWIDFVKNDVPGITRAFQDIKDNIQKFYLTNVNQVKSIAEHYELQYNLKKNTDALSKLQSFYDAVQKKLDAENGKSALQHYQNLTEDCKTLLNNIQTLQATADSALNQMRKTLDALDYGLLNNKQKLQRFVQKYCSEDFVLCFFKANKDVDTSVSASGTSAAKKKKKGKASPAQRSMFDIWQNTLTRLEAETNVNGNAWTEAELYNELQNLGNALKQSIKKPETASLPHLAHTTMLDDVVQPTLNAYEAKHTKAKQKIVDDFQDQLKELRKTLDTLAVLNSVKTLLDDVKIQRNAAQSNTDVAQNHGEIIQNFINLETEAQAKYKAIEAWDNGHLNDAHWMKQFNDDVEHALNQGVNTLHSLNQCFDNLEHLKNKINIVFKSFEDMSEEECTKKGGHYVSNSVHLKKSLKTLDGMLALKDKIVAFSNSPDFAHIKTVPVLCAHFNADYFLQGYAQHTSTTIDNNAVDALIQTLGVVADADNAKTKLEKFVQTCQEQIDLIKKQDPDVQNLDFFQKHLDALKVLQGEFAGHITRVDAKIQKIQTLQLEQDVDTFFQSLQFKTLKDLEGASSQTSRAYRVVNLTGKNLQDYKNLETTVHGTLQKIEADKKAIDGLTRQDIKNHQTTQDFYKKLEEIEQKNKKVHQDTKKTVVIMEETEKFFDAIKTQCSEATAKMWRQILENNFVTQKAKDDAFQAQPVYGFVPSEKQKNTLQQQVEDIENGLKQPGSSKDSKVLFDECETQVAVMESMLQGIKDNFSAETQKNQKIIAWQDFLEKRQKTWNHLKQQAETEHTKRQQDEIKNAEKLVTQAQQALQIDENDIKTKIQVLEGIFKDSEFFTHYKPQTSLQDLEEVQKDIENKIAQYSTQNIVVQQSQEVQNAKKALDNQKAAVEDILAKCQKKHKMLNEIFVKTEEMKKKYGENFTALEQELNSWVSDCRTEHPGKDDTDAKIKELERLDAIQKSLKEIECTQAEIQVKISNQEGKEFDLGSNAGIQYWQKTLKNYLGGEPLAKIKKASLDREFNVWTKSDAAYVYNLDKCINAIADLTNHHKNYQTWENLSHQDRGAQAEQFKDAIDEIINDAWCLYRKKAYEENLYHVVMAQYALDIGSTDKKYEKYETYFNALAEKKDDIQNTVTMGKKLSIPEVYNIKEIPHSLLKWYVVDGATDQETWQFLENYPGDVEYLMQRFQNLPKEDKNPHITLEMLQTLKQDCQTVCDDFKTYKAWFDTLSQDEKDKVSFVTLQKRLWDQYKISSSTEYKNHDVILNIDEKRIIQNLPQDPVQLEDQKNNYNALQQDIKNCLQYIAQLSDEQKNYLGVKVALNWLKTIERFQSNVEYEITKKIHHFEEGIKKVAIQYVEKFQYSYGIKDLKVYNNVLESEKQKFSDVKFVQSLKETEMNQYPTQFTQEIQKYKNMERDIEALLKQDIESNGKKIQCMDVLEKDSGYTDLRQTLKEINGNLSRINQLKEHHIREINNRIHMMKASVPQAADYNYKVSDFWTLIEQYPYIRALSKEQAWRDYGFSYTTRKALYDRKYFDNFSGKLLDGIKFELPDGEKTHGAFIALRKKHSQTSEDFFNVLSNVLFSVQQIKDLVKNKGDIGYNTMGFHYKKNPTKYARYQNLPVKQRNNDRVALQYDNFKDQDILRLTSRGDNTCGPNSLFIDYFMITAEILPRVFFCGSKLRPFDSLSEKSKNLTKALVSTISRWISMYFDVAAESTEFLGEYTLVWDTGASKEEQRCMGNFISIFIDIIQTSQSIDRNKWDKKEVMCTDITDDEVKAIYNGKDFDIALKSFIELYNPDQGKGEHYMMNVDAIEDKISGNMMNLCSIFSGQNYTLFADKKNGAPGPMDAVGDFISESNDEGVLPLYVAPGSHYDTLLLKGYPYTEKQFASMYTNVYLYSIAEKNAEHLFYHMSVALYNSNNPLFQKIVAKFPMNQIQNGQYVGTDFDPTKYCTQHKDIEPIQDVLPKK